MATTNLNNLHYAYMNMIRHFHPGSEPYTGGDALFTALDNGWSVGDVVGYEEFARMGVRAIGVYYFELTRNGEMMTMPVISNPYVLRLMGQMDIRLVPKHAPAKARRNGS